MKAVCIGASNTLSYYQGGGYLWMFLNWALGFKRLGYRVIWADMVAPERPVERTQRELTELRARLRPFELGDSIALIPKAGASIPPGLASAALTAEDAASAQMLFSFRYDFEREFIERFASSCLFETDPGIIQQAIADRHFDVGGYDLYCTNSESVAAQSNPQFKCGIDWEHLPTGVCVEEWPVTVPKSAAAFTTVTQWWMVDQWMRDIDGEWYQNDKRAAFLPFLELPRKVSATMELAVNLDGDVEERTKLEGLGWRVRESHALTSTPQDFRDYVQTSLGEWSCAKPSYTRMKTAWVSDRSVCYLASGRPVVVQNTGPSPTLPNDLGMLRFTTLEEAAEMIRKVVADFPKQSRAARELAETQFSVTKLIPRLMNRIGM